MLSLSLAYESHHGIIIKIGQLTFNPSTENIEKTFFKERENKYAWKVNWSQSAEISKLIFKSMLKACFLEVNNFKYRVCLNLNTEWVSEKLFRFVFMNK